jgi:hypothetical protein
MTGSAIAAMAATITPIITALFIFIVIPLLVREIDSPDRIALAESSFNGGWPDQCSHM